MARAVEIQDEYSGKVLEESQAIYHRYVEILEYAVFIIKILKYNRRKRIELFYIKVNSNKVNTNFA